MKEQVFISVFKQGTLEVFPELDRDGGAKLFGSIIDNRKDVCVGVCGQEQLDGFIKMAERVIDYREFFQIIK